MKRLTYEYVKTFIENVDGNRRNYDSRELESKNKSNKW